jgi:hypothetical protein
MIRKGIFIGILSLTQLLSAQLPQFEWARSIGGLNDDQAYSMACDHYGNVYVTGFFKGNVDFDPGPGSFPLTATYDEVFVLKLNPAGDFVWARDFDCTIDNQSISMTIDLNGNVYTTGYFQGTTDFDPGPGVYNLISPSSYNIFISKLDSSGNFIWAKNIGGASTEYTNSIVTDAFGSVYTTGIFQGIVDFDPGAGIANVTSNGNYDAFVLKLDSSGGFAWAGNIGGTLFDYGKSLVLDTIGNVYITGTYQSVGDFDPGAGVFNLTSAGLQDIFYCKLDNSGNFLWAKSIGGPTTDNVRTIVLDDNTIYSTGYFNGTSDFDPGPSAYPLTSSVDDIFVLKLDGSGNFIWAKNMGGTSYNGGNALCVDHSKNVFVTGYYSGTVDFDPGAATYPLIAPGDDIYIVKLDSSGNFIGAASIGDTNTSYGNAILTDPYNNIYITGTYHGTADFDIGAATYNQTSGNDDIYVLKLNQCNIQPTTIVLDSLISSTISGAGYQWINCSNNAIIPGETNQSFIASSTGSYAVIVNTNGCADTSACQLITISNAGLENYNSQNGLVIFPNPSEGIIYMNLKNNTENATLKIFQLNGAVIFQKNQLNGNQFSLDISAFPNGMYMVELTDGNHIFRTKLIKN